MHQKLIDIRKTMRIVRTGQIEVPIATEKVPESFYSAGQSSDNNKSGTDIYTNICIALNENKPNETEIQYIGNEFKRFKDVVLLNECEFDEFFAWNTWIQAHSLANLLYTVFVREKLMEHCKITKKEFIIFLNTVSYAYNRNKYHNIYHALDITVRVYHLYKKIENRYIQNKNSLLCLLIGSLLHDAGHMGFRSIFLANHSEFLAKKFGSESLNEKMHFLIAKIILQNEEYSVIKNLSETEQNNIIQNIEEMIISTDLKRHNLYVKIFKDLPLDISDIIVKGPFRMISKIELITLLKITDLSNSTTDYACFNYIGDLVISEENDERYFSSETRWKPENAECNNYKLAFLETYLLDYCDTIGKKFIELRFLYDKALENSKILQGEINGCSDICMRYR